MSEENKPLPTVDEVAMQITDLVSKYRFPVEVLRDVDKRLADSPDSAAYALQQLRFLKKVINAGMATERVQS